MPVQGWLDLFLLLSSLKTGEQGQGRDSDVQDVGVEFVVGDWLLLVRLLWEGDRRGCTGWGDTGEDVDAM